MFSIQPYRLNQFFCYPILLIILYHNILYTQSPKNTINVIARVGNTYITEQEFVERYEMLPGLYRHRKSKLEESKINLLYSMIAEKLLAQESKSNSYDNDTLYKSIMYDLTKLFARDELYRLEITNKTKVSSDDVKKGIDRAIEQIQIEYFYFDQENDANFLRSQLRNAHNFDNILIDSSWNIYLDTATVIWGDADPIIEDEAYSLKSNEISHVIHSGDGYYIMHIMNRHSNTFYTSMQPAVLREKVESIIRLMKEEIRLNEFVNQALQAKIGYAVPKQFKLLVKSLRTVFQMQQYRNRTALDIEMARDVKDNSRSFINDTIAVAGKLSWTVNNVIDRLLTQGFCIDSSTTNKHLASLLNKQQKIWVQQELIAQEAISRGLDTTTEVRQQIDLWSSYYLAEIMKARIKSSVSVSDAEVWSYLKSNDSTTQAPQVKLRILRTTSMDQMDEAMKELSQGIPFESIINRWSNDTVMKRAKGLTEYFPITQRWPLGEIASQLNIDQNYGPFRLRDGIYFIRLVSKRFDTSDTSFSSKKKSAELELLSFHQKNKINLFIAQAVQKLGYEIFYDRLKSISISSIPMMTYRTFGFGGKMTALPLTEPQSDWINIEPPSSPIIP